MVKNRKKVWFKTTIQKNISYLWKMYNDGKINYERLNFGAVLFGEISILQTYK